MGKTPWLLFLPPLIFLGLALLFYTGMQRENPNRLLSTLIGQAAPPITPARLSNFPEFEQSQLVSGGVTLVNFWASWCPPCRAEHPKLLEMAGAGMPIIGVNFKDDAGNAAAYLAKDGNPFRAVAFDPAGRTAIDWGVTAPPETFILDAKGTVLFRFAGPLVGSDYAQRFVPALQQALGQ